jgi:hypothetical protein
MPLYWMIDSKERVFTGSGEGEVTLADAMALLDSLAGAKALSYRKLFDGRAVRSAMTGDDLLAVAARVRAYHEVGPIGALAIVGTDEQFDTFARLLGALAAADRPMKMFTKQAVIGWTNRPPNAPGYRQRSSGSFWPCAAVRQSAVLLNCSRRKYTGRSW